jgi:Rps23 Pro-64 3,4-dihydroxylase Tpa1-like proline 4-hydroxylase|tara:strand:- start:50 stop:589 length:540 start_codon:yes stop_codon:yes gene_type:complete
MKLIYQIPNKLYYIQQFLDYPSYKQLHKEIFDPKLKQHNTDETWIDDLKYGHKTYVSNTGFEPDKHKILLKLKILLQNNPFINIEKNLKYSFMQHSMKDGAGINWHNDEGHEYGITYYLNRRWSQKFGGEFLFKHETSNGFIPLVGNSIVILKAPFWHKVSSVLKPLIPRKTIQIFVDK